MAFDATMLSRVAHGAGNSLYLYKTADPIATVNASGYFNAVSDQFFQHDVIICTSSTGGTVVTGLVLITSATRAVPVTSK